MTTIGKVAYMATWDATQLVRGVMTSRQQFSAQRKIIESMKTPLERYSSDLENLKTITEKYPAVAKHQLQLHRQLERQYLQEASAVRSLTAAESKRLRTLDIATSGKAAGIAKSPVDINRERGLAEQARIQRLTANADKEAAIGRRALQDRLRVYKAEKAANKQRTRDEQLEFNRQMRNTEIAERKRARLLNTGAYGARNAGRGVGGKLAGSLGGLGSVASGALPMLGGVGLGIGSVAFVKNAATMHASIERSTAALEVFTGSAAKAASMMGRMRDLAAESGVGFDALQRGASTMLSFGVSVERVTPAMRQLAEITRGDAERFASMSLAYAQAGAAGKLMGQDLLQMVNAGFNPLMEISRKTGKSLSQLRAEMSAGKISFNQVADAFRSATAAGGKFHGMMDKIADTSAGSLSRVSAEWSIFLDKFGQSIEPVTKGVAAGMSSSLSILSTAFSQWDDAVERRMAAAKKSGGQGANDRNLFGLQTSLAKAAVANNDLDAKLAKYQEKNRKFEKMREPEKDFVGPKPTQAGKSEIYDLQTQLQTQLGLIDKIAVRRKELMDKGLNGIEVQRVMYMERQLELIEKQKSAWQKMQDDRKAELDQMRDRAEQITKSLQTPMQAYRAELADLILMRRRGMINQETMMRGANAAADKLPRDEQQRQEAPRPTAMRAGSAELYEYLAGKQREALRINKGGNEAVQQTKVLHDLAGLTREGNRTLAMIRDGLPKFGSDS